MDADPLEGSAEFSEMCAGRRVDISSELIIGDDEGSNERFTLTHQPFKCQISSVPLKHRELGAMCRRGDLITKTWSKRIDSRDLNTLFT
jgi:hypothetical protein